MRLVARGLLLLLLSGCSSQPSALPVPTPPASVETTEAEAGPSPWDPREVDELPAAGRRAAPGLPDRVDPPDAAPLLRDHPIAAAVLTVERRGGRLQLLGIDGSWREVRLAERYPREMLSPNGTRLAALLGNSIEVWHLPTGTRVELPLPERFEPWDYASIGWVDGSTLLLDDLGGGWLVDVTSGSAEPTDFPRRARFSWMIDHDGVLVESTGPTSSPAIFDWVDGTPRRIDLSDLGTPIRIYARDNLVAGTAYGEPGFATFALDRADPASVRRRPILDFEGSYSNWALRTFAVLADATVLLWVAVPGPAKVDGWRLVRWTPRTDRLEVVTTSDADPTWSLGFARDLLDAAPRTRQVR